MSSEGASRHLKLFFSFPPLHVILFANLLLELLISTIMLVSFPILKTLPQILLLLFTPSLFSILTHATFFYRDEIFTLRRFLALQLVQEAIYASLLTSGALSALLLTIGPSRALSSSILLGTSVTSFISFLVIIGFCRRNTLIVIAISLLNMILQSFRWIVMSITLFENLVEFLLVMLSSFSMGVLLLAILNLKKVEDKISPLKVFQAYLDYHFNKNEGPLESFLEEMSREINLKLSSATFKVAGGPPLSVIGLNIHFGPFGTLGSSPLPSYLVEDLEDRSGHRILLFRFLSNHNFNLPSRREVEKVKDMIMVGLNSAKKSEVSPAGFSQRELEGYCVTAARLGHYCLVFLSCPGHSVEDLPPEWLPDFFKIFERHNFTPLLICDAHNSIDSSRWIVSNPDEKIFANLLEEVVKDLEGTKGRNLGVGFHRVRPRGLPADEVGPGGISALVFNVDGENHAIVVIDGNNMVMGMRNHLVESLRKSFKISTLEITTTDTHILTGLRKAEKGYFPVGFKTNVGTLFEACRESIAGAIEGLSPCELEVYNDDTRQVRVTGEIFKKLEGLIGYFERTIAILITTLISSIVLLLYSFAYVG